MKIIKYAFIALYLLLATTGCNLDATMYDGIIAEELDPRNIGEVSQGSYRLLQHDDGLIDAGYVFRNFGSDDLSWGGTSTGGTFAIYDYTRNMLNFKTEYTWELAYRAIGNCNLVIEMAQGFGENITPEQTLMMGENYYIRALCYFYMVNEFAQPYSNNPTQNPGLPLKLDSDPDNLPPARATVAEVYAQVESDLLDAITHLTLPAGATPKANIYATKEAAQALLARVYLYMGPERFDEAYNMADAVIQSGRFNLETGERYATYPQHIPESNKETIFAVRRTANVDAETGTRPGEMLIRVDNTGWEEVSPSSRYLELLELYHNANGMPQDLRSRFVVKRYVENGTTDYSVTGYPDRIYNQWWFAYARKQAGDNPHYEYGRIRVTKSGDTYTIINAADAAQFKSTTIQSESYNLGTRYYVETTNDVKYIGRVEPEVFDASRRSKDSRNLNYAINKCSYQEQRRQLWSPVISRLAEMYLIRAEVNAERGDIQPALDDVNELRRRAGIPEWTMSNMAGAERDANGTPINKDIKKIVEEERMLELAWEGHRRFDIFRRKQTLDRRYPGAHTYMSAAGKYLEVPYNSPAVCEFIPQGQYDNYPYPLEQNPVDN